MGDTLFGVLALFIGGPTAWSRALLIAGSVLALVNSFRFLMGRPGVRMAADGAPPPVRPPDRTSFHHGPDAALYLPLALILLGAGMGVFRAVPWFTGAAALLGWVVYLSVRRLRAEHGRRGEDLVAGPALAVVLATATLVLVGAIMTVRLEIVPDPADGFASSATADSWTQLAGAVALPLFVIGGLLAGARRCARKPGAQPWTWKFGPTSLYLACVVAVVALFAAPLVWPEGKDDNDLLFAWFATAEYGKVLYLFVLAVVLARYAIGFQVRPGKLLAGPWTWQQARRALDKSKHVGYTILLFGLVAGVGLPKSDIGPTIPLFVSTVAMVVFLLRHQTRAGARWRDTLASSRSLWFALVLVGLVGTVVLQTDYVRTRQEAWHQPWTYDWSSSCVTPPVEVVPPADLPDRTVPCLESLDAVSAGKRSQVARSLAAVADGGLWGRGLSDIVLGQFPAGSTDFVLALVWNKLGGIVVLLLGAILAVLAAALTRIRTHLTRLAGTDVPAGQRHRRAARLFAVGVAGMLVGQFGFVFAATLNLLPHSGITAPFLSRGGQSTLALLAAVLIAVWLLYRADRPPTPAPADAARIAVEPRPALIGVWLARLRTSVPLVFGLMVFAIVLATVCVTVAPYGQYAEGRPLCRAGKARVDPERCSTDRTANRRTTVELRIDGVAQHTRDRTQPSSWDPVGTPALTLGDLAGLVRLRGYGGVLDDGLARTVEGGSGTALRERLLPDPDGPEPGHVDLTLDPDIQRTMAAALRSGADGDGPLAGGVVVMDARSGHVLAAASAPSALDWPETAAAPKPNPDQVNAYRDNHPHYGPIDGGAVDESDADCHSIEWDNRCWRWSALAAPGPEDGVALTERRRYAPNTPDAVLPSLNQNRALGRRYGLGSTFKVVVAAAFLGDPGKSAESPIPSPPTYQPESGERIDNYTPGPCAGTDENGMITLKQALTVSCNTAFVALAERLGWPRIRDTALRLGFVDQSPAGPDDRAWLAGPPAGVASQVPHDANAAGMGGIGNNALGGGAVTGTPLQLATVMTVIANGGRVVQPTIVASTADPFGRAETRHRGEVRDVLSAEQAGELGEALAGVAGDGGTAHRLRAGAHRELRVKTGTHEMYGEHETADDGSFARQVAWVVGTLDTEAGPVTFAVAVETRDEAAGSRRAQWLAQRVIDTVAEVRG